MPVGLLLSATLAVGGPQSAYDSGRIVPGAIGVPSAVDLLDADLDGRLDIAVSEAGTGIVHLFRDRGASDFEPPREILNVGNAIGGLAAGDIDNDGDEDLVLLTLSGSVSSWISDGGGGFSLGAQVGFLGSVPGAAVLLDVDGDGRLDVVTEPAAGASGVQVLLGIGGGGFAAPSDPVIGGLVAQSARFVDVDSDGDLDLFARSLTGPATHQLTLFTNTGSYPLDPANGVDVGATAMLPDLLGVYEPLDVDGDGDADVALASGQSATLGWIENLGGGVFAPARSIGTSTGIDRIRVVDQNGDGRLDLVFHRKLPLVSGTLGLARGTVAGGFLDLGDFGPARDSSLGLEAGLLSGATLPTLVAISGRATALASAPPLVELYPGTPAGYADPLPPLSESIGLNQIVAIDIDQDGNDDLLSLDAGSRALVIKRSLGDGRFMEDETVVPTPGMPQGSVQRYAVGDIDSDGVDDLVFLYESTTSPSLYARSGRPGGGLDSPIVLVPLSAMPFGSSQLLLNDLTGDALPDALVMGDLGLRPYLSINLGGGAFGPFTPISPVNLSGGGLSTEDMDGDGRRDVVLTVADSVLWLRNLGAGQFLPAEILYTTSTFLVRYRILDVDEDGRPDLIVTAASTNGDPARLDISWARSLGGAQFATAVALVENVLELQRFEVTDANVDGLSDLLYTTRAMSSVGSQFHLALGTAPGAFAAPVSVPIDGVNTFVDARPTFLDLNGDGADDLVVGATVPISRIHFSVALNLALGDVGDAYCTPGVPNSTGVGGSMGAFGSDLVAAGRLTLLANRLPVGVPGIFLVSRTAGFIPTVQNSIGTLCLAGQIGRFVGPGQIQVADASGSFALEVDLQAFPSPSVGAVAVLPGDAWKFQAWYRDMTSISQPTSNFTSALSVTFR